MTSEAQQVKTIPTSVWNKKGLHACTNNENSSCSGLDLMSLICLHLCQTSYGGVQSF